MLAGVNDSTVFLSLLLISMYVGFCFGAGGFPVIECRTANSASVLNFLRISINLAADVVEQAAVLLRALLLQPE